jgi:hypothetical protein
MKATCQSRVIFSETKTVTDRTPYGPFEKDVKVVVTEKHWTNYPGKVSEFIQYAVDTYWNSRLIEGHITPNLPAFAQ